jgi:hypothetical protein
VRREFEKCFAVPTGDHRFGEGAAFIRVPMILMHLFHDLVPPTRTRPPPNGVDVRWFLTNACLRANVRKFRSQRA